MMPIPIQEKEWEKKKNPVHKFIWSEKKKPRVKFNILQDSKGRKSLALQNFQLYYRASCLTQQT